MQNQRKESRKKLIAFTPVYNLLHKKLIGYVGDLTPQGVLVIGENPMEIDKNLALGIEFPSDDAESSVLRMAISGRTAWCRRDEDTPQYFNIGFEFIGTSQENAEIIEMILGRYQFRYVASIDEFKR